MVQPGNRRWVVVGAVVLVATLCGVGGFLVGASTGADIERARAVGTAIGKEVGAARGEDEGYKNGFRRGKRQGFDATFERAFRKGYIRAYSDVGLEAPRPDEIKVADR